MTKSLVTISPGKNAEAILRTYELFVYVNMHCTVGRGSTRSQSVEKSLWKGLWTCRNVDSKINDITLPVYLVKVCQISDTPRYVVNWIFKSNFPIILSVSLIHMLFRKIQVNVYIQLYGYSCILQSVCLITRCQHAKEHFAKAVCATWKVERACLILSFDAT